MVRGAGGTGGWCEPAGAQGDSDEKGNNLGNGKWALGKRSWGSG